LPSCYGELASWQLNHGEHHCEQHPVPLALRIRRKCTIQGVDAIDCDRDGPYDSRMSAWTGEIPSEASAA
jgi:hypothetical protein